jgi:hypothetical protein
VSEASRVHVFRPQDGGEEHYAIEIGTLTVKVLFFHDFIQHASLEI